MAVKHNSITDSNEIHVPKGFSEANPNHGLIKNAEGNLEWVPTSELGGAEGPPGSLQKITVADINDPKTELNAANLATYGRFLYVVQTPLGNDSITMYVYDDSNSNAENSPYILNTLDGGNTRWVAVGGKYNTTITTSLDGSRPISSAEISKLAGIESNATADQTGAEIKAAYEAEANTNAFTDAEKTKLTGIASGATANDTDANLKNRANHTGTQTASTISDFQATVSANSSVTANTAKVSADGSVTTHSDVTDAGSGAIITTVERSKLSGIESGATADQTGAEIKIAYEAEANTNAFTDAEQTKLAGIASGATVNSTDAFLLARANHTGTQLSTTISDFTSTARAAAYKNFQMVSTDRLAASTTYNTISQWHWDQSEYSGFTQCTVFFYAEVSTRLLDVRVQNLTTATTLGSTLAINATGAYTFTFTLPTADAKIAIQIRKDSTGGADPIVGSLSIRAV